MGRSGVINKQFAGEENEAYHDIIALFKIYRSVNWRMQIKVNQVKHRIQWEYGTDIDTFLDSVYQAGMDINQDLGDMKERIHRATYFRWREQAFEAVSGILWGYEEESRRIIEYFKNNYESDQKFC